MKFKRKSKRSIRYAISEFSLLLMLLVVLGFGIIIGVSYNSEAIQFHNLYEAGLLKCE